MSTILKALRRLEQEKSAASDRPLSEALANAPVPPQRRRRSRRGLAAAVVLAVVAGAGAFVWLRRAAEPADGAPVEVAATTAPKPPSPDRTRPNRASRPAARPRAERPRPPVATGAPAPSGTVAMAPSDLGAEASASFPERQPSVFPRATNLRPELPPEALASEVEVVRRLRPDVPPSSGTGPPTTAAPSEASPSPRVARRPQGSSRPAATAKTAPPPAAEPQVAAVSPPPPREVEPQGSSSPEPAEPPPAPTAEPPPPAEPVSRVARPSAAASAPRAKQVSRSPVPDLVVEKTIWHPLAERRVAVVVPADGGEAVELHEGDAFGPLVVAAIEPTGVVFLHDGVELRRRVGAR